MADTEVVEPGSFSENLDSRLEKIRDAKDARAEGRREQAADAQADGAEPTPVAEPQPVTDWKDWTLPEDIDHGFFRGKKVPVLLESYKHAETAKQQAERERNEWRQKAEQLQREREAEAAARRVAAEPRAIQPGEDPRWQQVHELWFTDNQKASRVLAEINRDEASKIAAQEIQKYRQEAEAGEQRKRVMEAGGKAYDEARQKLNLDTKLWNLRAPAVMLQLTDENSPYYGDGYNVFRTEAYLQVYRDIYGETPAAPIVVKQTPELPTPPGSKKPTPVTPAENAVSPLSRERQDAVERFAAIGGVDPKRLAERAARRLGERRG